MTTSRHRLEQPSQWLILALVLFLVLVSAAVFLVLIRNAGSAASMRHEVQKGLQISDMVAAVQIESERAGAYAGQIMGMQAMQAGDSMESVAGQAHTTGEPQGRLQDDPALLAAIVSLEQAARSLEQFMTGSDQAALDGVTAAHSDFVASIAAFDVQVTSGGDSMSFYHGNTQLFEAVLRASLQDLESDSRLRLQSAIDATTSAENLLRWTVPLLLIGGIAAAVYLRRMQVARRRIVTLEHLVDAKSDFIAAVSHELRTPLTAVVGYTELLRESGAELSPSDRVEMMAAVADQSAEVTAIVDDLLVAARADIGELTVAKVPVDLRAQTAQICEAFDLCQLVAVVGEAPTASGDPARVRQILRNLLANAVRHGGDQISVELGGHRDGSASLIVKDDGPPIPIPDREWIFEPYEHAQGQPKPGSIGLGLTVSQRLARLMGGDLTYRHQDGHSIFELTLPVVDQIDLKHDRPAAELVRQPHL